MIKKIISAFTIIIIVGLAFVWYTDYKQVTKSFKPKFCLKEELYNYTDGTTTRCIGPGYNVYKYERTSISGYEFSPFWVKMKE